MITFQCDKNGCDRKIWFTSYYQQEWRDGKPISNVTISLPLEAIENLKKALPANYYIKEESIMLCQDHQKEYIKRIEERDEVNKKSDEEWLNTGAL